MEFKRYKLKDVGEVVGGATPLTSDSSNYDGDISWITPNDLSNHKSPYISKGERNITQKGLKEIGNRLYPPGTVLFSSRAPIGYVAIAEKELCTNQGFKSIIPDLELTTSEYLYYLLGYYKHYIEKKGAGTTFKEVSGSVMENIELPFPSLDNQRKIASYLMSIDQKISLNTRMNAELEAMAKQLYDYWFVQFDFPDENGKPYKSSGGKMVWNEKLKREIPDGWEVKEISSILDKVKSTPRLVTDEYLKLGDFPIIDQATDVYYAGFTNREDAVSHQYPAVIFGDHSCVVKYVNFPFVRGADGTQVMLSKNKNVSIEYLYFVIKQIKVSKGYARHYGFIKDSMIIIPSHTITLKFKSVVELLFFQITESRKEMVYLTHLRDSLLPMLMNGQVKVE